MIPFASIMKRPLKTYSTLDLSNEPLNQIYPQNVIEKLAPKGAVAFQRLVMTTRQIAELKMRLKSLQSDDADTSPISNEPAHITHPVYEQPPAGAVGSVAGAWLVEKYV